MNNDFSNPTIKEVHEWWVLVTALENEFNRNQWFFMTKGDKRSLNSYKTGLHNCFVALLPIAGSAFLADKNMLPEIKERYAALRKAAGWGEKIESFVSFMRSEEEYVDKVEAYLPGTNYADLLPSPRSGASWEVHTMEASLSTALFLLTAIATYLPKQESELRISDLPKPWQEFYADRVLNGRSIQNY